MYAKKKKQAPKVEAEVEPEIPEPVVAEPTPIPEEESEDDAWDEKSWDEVELPQLIKTHEQLQAEEQVKGI